MALHLRRLLALLALSVLSAESWSADSSQWEFWIQQGDAVFHNPTSVRLKRAPFSIKFHGPELNTYGVAATAVESELPVSNDLSSVFRVGNGLLVDKPNTKITVSAPGVIAKGWSSWNMWAYHSSAEVKFISGFQERKLAGDGTATLTRTIDLVCTDDGVKDLCSPVSGPPFEKFFALIATIPDLSPGEKLYDTRWIQPRMLSVEFE